MNYNLPIQTGGCNQMTRKSYKEMSGEEKKNSDERRIKYYKKISSELIEVALMNPFMQIPAHLSTVSDKN